MSTNPPTPKIVPIPPVISGMARNWAIRTIAGGLTLGIFFAECYRRLYAEPRQRKIEEYYKERGVEFEKII